MSLFNAENEAKSKIAVKASGKPLYKGDFKDDLSANKMDFLKILYKFLFGKTSAMSKPDMVNTIADLLCFTTESRFKEWFFALPELTQKIFHKGAFTDYVSISVLEKELGVTLLEKNARYSWQVEWNFKPEYNIEILPVIDLYNCPFTMIPVVLWKSLNAWLVPPASASLSGCRAPDQTETWENSALISDIFPLLCDALRHSLERMGKDNPEKLVRSGFKKKEINDLRASTGFLPFKLEGDNAPFGIDMAARFILCMKNFKPLRPKDGQDEIRNLVMAFFSESSKYPRSWYFPDRAFLEYSICIDHLSRPPGTYFEGDSKLPLSRRIFWDILYYVAKDGNWFDTDKLAEYIRSTREDFSFCSYHLSRKLKAKAESFVFDGAIFSSGYDGEFHPEGNIRFYLLARPLFKAYCYIFAALGLLEITQETPPLVRNYREKLHPFSIYDSLKAIRITAFGRWCLGLTDKRPEKPPQEYQAIADRELLLVTVQGNSLERQVYLDRIGQRLGENRWRISPASFIAGCINKRDIVERIERFKQLIDSKPAPHWELLFRKIVDRAGLFDTKRSDILVYDLPEDRELQDEILRDPEIKRIIRRVEGRMVAVAAKNQTKFFALLSEHGIAHF